MRRGIQQTMRAWQFTCQRQQHRLALLARKGAQAWMVVQTALRAPRIQYRLALVLADLLAFLLLWSLYLHQARAL